ncbi:MAG: DNA recombination protein RmuC [Nocardioidaceae bacterium]
MDSTTIYLAGVTLFLGLALGILLGQRMAARSGADLREDLRAFSAQAANESSQQVLALTDARMHAAESVVAPVRESLDRLDSRLGSLETQNASWQSQLKQQVESVHLSGTELQRETRALAEALRRPQVRGHWGEMQLKRSLELAGLLSRCTFDEQVSRHTDDGVLRPDVVISMAGGKSVVIDSKVSLDAFLSATHAVDPTARDEGLARHARQVRQHVDSLAAKSYWRQFAPAPEFVVMFLPAEALFAQALETDPTLLDYAASKQVMLATPTTLIAMLKTVAYAWTQEALADNAREVHQLGRELYDRLGTVGKHLDALGRSLTGAVGNYNKAMGSLESRVLVTARRMRDLEVTDQELPTLGGVVATTTPLTAPELVTDEEPVLIEGTPGRERWTRGAVG